MNHPAHELYRRPHLKPFRVINIPAPSAPPQETEVTVLGVDFGQSIDPTAACLLARKRYPSDFEGPRDSLVRMKYLRRWETGTDYVQVVDDLLDLAPTVLVPEFNGVGRAVVDLLRQRAVQRGYTGSILPVVTAASNVRLQDNWEARGRHITVPKIDLVTAIQILYQTKTLRTPPENKVPELRALKQEMRDFQIRYSARTVQLGNATPGRHDDLVIATGLASWWMLRMADREPEIFIG